MSRSERQNHLEPLPRMIAEGLLSRVAGAALVEGNAVRLLRDAAENYPAWLDAIAAAERTINFENYIIDADEVGRMFADALITKARQGVTVRVLYDWMGNFRRTPAAFWARLRDAGIEVRCFNRPSLDSPLGWLSRNHRKTVSVDGRIGFVSGLCVGRDWVGDAARGIAPWRDTGVEIRGPAVVDIERAFRRSWSAAGTPITSDDDAPPAAAAAPDGAGIAVRVIETQPNTMALYRLDQLIAALARESLWLTDAYFVGTTAYVGALCQAARDGVDVRLLVPGASDIPIVQTLARAGYRPLLEAGIRVFEWRGPMLHAKTAVADGRWARVGSSNLNLASWLGNWELDVATEDEDFAAQMESMYLDDLENSTEIVLDGKALRATMSVRPRGQRRRRRG
ncbi:MAG TPA: phospholipase D-like domain-containing protein, partial [Stellaceae bacterium]|nr:phospholipase D-like domain-containing protein [Stellaceae bacterium]